MTAQQSSLEHPPQRNPPVEGGRVEWRAGREARRQPAVRPGSGRHTTPAGVLPAHARLADRGHGPTPPAPPAHFPDTRRPRSRGAFLQTPDGRSTPGPASWPVNVGRWLPGTCRPASCALRLDKRSPPGLGPVRPSVRSPYVRLSDRHAHAPSPPPPPPQQPLPPPPLRKGQSARSSVGVRACVCVRVRLLAPPPAHPPLAQVPFPQAPFHHRVEEGLHPSLPSHCPITRHSHLSPSPRYIYPTFFSNNM